MKIKTRFAPSPTGSLHLGGIRTALYSWLYARHNQGKFILRIEDTDIERSTPQAVKEIIDSMKWLKINWDEGPYYQSSRLNRYNIVINDMLKTGTAYKCYCSKERLENLRKNQISQGDKPKYDSFCRYNKNSLSVNNNYVVRFCNPQEGSVIFYDKIRGKIEFHNKDLDDVIIQRTDGSPTYNFCVVVDDWDMEITHIIRGEDHISNTPRQINILKALGANIPIYAHVSMILNHDGRKFSKRLHSMSIMQYRKNGYLPEALLNYLVRLGWSHGNQEIFSIEEMINLFDLNALNKSASILNVKKLKWINHFYIKTLPPEYIATHLKWHIKIKNIDISNGPNLTNLVKLFANRCKTLIEIIDSSRYFYDELKEHDEIIIKQYFNKVSNHALEKIYNKFSLINDENWKFKNINNAIKQVSHDLKIQVHEVIMPLRVAVTGSTQSPPIDLTVEAIGRIRTIKRIKKALELTHNGLYTINI